jgi:hypothetical protein
VLHKTMGPQWAAKVRARHSFTAQQQTLRRLDSVFAVFCGRRKAVGKSISRW